MHYTKGGWGLHFVRVSLGHTCICSGFGSFELFEQGTGVLVCAALWRQSVWIHLHFCKQAFSRLRHFTDCSLKQQNRYLSVIIVCGYFSFIRSFTWLNFLSKSNSNHKTSLSMSFGCWHLSGIPLCPLHFTVYTIAWQRKFEPQWVFNINLCILSG